MPSVPSFQRSDSAAAKARPAHVRFDVVSAAGLVVILMMIAAAITAILSHYQRISLATWLALLFVCLCFAGAYAALDALVMPRVERRARAAWVMLGARALVVVGAVLVGGEIAARTLELLGGDPAARTRAHVLPVGLALTVALVIVEQGYRRLRRRAREHELREERLRREAMKAELAAIQARTDPHFLFNSLNTVAGLVEEDPPRAAEVLQRMAALFHYALDGARSERVPLGEELRAVRSYLEIEGLRFGDRLRWSVTADDGLLEWPVPPLVLQPLVENSVRYAIAPRRGPGRVEVRIEGGDGGLWIEVEDDGDRGRSAMPGTGTSLADLRERLELSYGAAASLERGEGRLGGYRVRIHIPRVPAGEPEGGA